MSLDGQSIIPQQQNATKEQYAQYSWLFGKKR
jgi:hypothetical protein